LYNVESINNVLKINTNWKPQSLATLIEKLFSVVKLQYLDTRRAMYGAGKRFPVSVDLKDIVDRFDIVVGPQT
jgi:hypothetical protein